MIAPCTAARLKEIQKSKDNDGSQGPVIILHCRICQVLRQLAKRSLLEFKEMLVWL
jgi:hypothetical protein